MYHNKLIIGLSGEICAGKDATAKLLINFFNYQLSQSVSHFHFSDLLTIILEEMSISKSRRIYDVLSQVLFRNCGQDIFAQCVYKKTRLTNDEVVIWNGIRSKYDVQFLRKFKKNILVYIESDLETRYKRLIQRNRDDGDITKSLADFIEDQSRSTEVYITEIKKSADLVVPNKDRELNKTLDIVLETLRSNNLIKA